MPGVADRLACSPEGRYLAAAGPKNTILLWDLARRCFLRQLKAPGSWIRDLAFSPDGRILALADFDGTGCLLDVATGKELHRLRGHTDWLSFVSFSPNGKLVATGSSDGTSRIWEVKTGKQLRLLTDAGQVLAGSFSPDGRMLAATGTGTGITLWEVATATVRGRLEGHSEMVEALAFSADGKTLVSGSSDTTLLVWETLATSDRRGVGKPLGRGQLEACWKTLADGTAQQAWEAIRTLIRSPRDTVGFLGQRLEAVPAVAPGRVAELVGQLGSDKFQLRQRAFQELERLAEIAEPALTKALQTVPSLEMRRRVERLLGKLEYQRPPVERLRTLRALEVLEYVGTPEAQNVLHRLAEGAAWAWLTHEAKASSDRLAKRLDGRP
jgi:hypothetical protein